MSEKQKKGRGNIKALRNRIWFILNILFTCIYLIWRGFFTIPLEYGIVSLVAGIALFAVELLGMVEAMIHYFNMHRVETYPVPEIPEELFPHVDVLIATYNEPVDILFKTVNGCKHMEYPDKSKVHIYLCDDGRRPAVRALAEKMDVGYLDRPDNKHAKAGNLNNALSKTTSPYIVTFDADMIPRREFLLRTLPHFVAQELENEGKEEKDQKHIGFVQSPQSFYNPDLFQFFLYSEGRIPNEQDYFYRDIQVARNRSNSVIYGGSNTVLARRALDAIDGFFTGTITEDYGTGIKIQKKKFRCIATNEVLASGLSPTDLKSLIDQRIRWARGVISTNRKLHVILTPHLTIAQKLNYWASEWYWFAPLKRLIYFMSPILFATFNYMVIKCTLPQILIFWLPMYITSNVSLRMLSRNIRNTKWTSIYETVLFPFMLVPVILEFFGITMKKFKVTKKGGVENERGKNLLYAVPFILLVILSVVGIVRCVVQMFESNSMGPAVVLFWLIYNLFILIMATFFVLGRNFQRKSERTRVEMDCDIQLAAGQYHGRTLDISETGIAVRMESPVCVDFDEEVLLHLNDGRYQATVKAVIVHVDDRNDFWKFAFRITDYLESEREYMQLVYDRIPTLPQSLDRASGGFDDLMINFTRRTAKPFYEKRRLPRIPVQLQVKDTDGNDYTLCDFNYQYCTCKCADTAPERMQLVLDEAGLLVLDCQQERQLNNGSLLYQVTNYDAFYQNAEKKAILEQWVSDVWQNREQARQLEAAAQPAPEEKKEETAFDEMSCV